MKEFSVEERVRQWGPEFLGASELAGIIAEDADPAWLLSASFHELRLRLGASRGDAIGAALELGRRLTASQAPREELTHPDAVGRWAMARITQLPHEELWLLSTDARGGLLSARRVAQGSVHGLSVRIADILKIAVREGAVGFVLVHNHPAGDPTPSAEDIQLTHKVATASESLGIALLDHVVVARASFYSILTRVRRDIEERSRSEWPDTEAPPPAENRPAPVLARGLSPQRSTRRR